MLKIRDNATIKELNIPKDVLEVIENSKVSDDTKVRVINKLTGGLCSCGKVPSHEVIKGVNKLLTTTEHYCQDCLKKEYSIFHSNIPATKLEVKT